MTKSEFLDRLRSALGNDLNGAVIQENVDYYSGYISDETGRGRAEEEVIEELGDPWVLAQTVIDSVEGKNNAGPGYEEDYGYSSGQTAYGRQQGNAERTYRAGAGAWWKRLLFILGVVGIVMVAAAVVGGIISFLVPFIVPAAIIVLVIRTLRRR